MSIHDDFRAQLRKDLKEYKPEEEVIEMTQKKQLSKKQIKEMVEKRKAGAKVKDLAKEYGISTGTVSYHINKADSLEVLHNKDKTNHEKVNDIQGATAVIKIDNPDKKIAVEEQFTNELIVPEGKAIKIELTITVGP